MFEENIEIQDFKDKLFETVKLQRAMIRDVEISTEYCQLSADMTPLLGGDEPPTCLLDVVAQDFALWLFRNGTILGDLWLFRDPLV